MWQWVGRVALVAVAYFAAGKLALMLAIPPGYATAVWPSAGIALVAVLRCGPRVLPGVFLGSAAVNLPTSFELVDPARAIAVASGVAIGPALQAYVGAVLVRRFVRDYERLANDRDIVRFVVVGGALGCVVSATISSVVLTAFGTVGDSPAFSWFTWWVGDAIGVAIFAPCLLAFIGKPRAVWAPRRSAVVVPLAVGIALVTVLFARASRWERDRAEAAQVHDTAVIAHAVTQQLRHYVDVTQSLARFIDAEPELDRAQFHAFALGALSRDPAIRGLGYSPWVPREERAQFEANVAREVPGYEVFWRDASGARIPAGNADEYFPSLFAEPNQTQNLGFDFASDPARKRTLAMLGGHGVALSEPLVFFQTGERGFVIASRVVRGGVALTGIRGEAFLARSIEGLGRDAATIAILDGAQRSVAGTPAAGATTQSIEIADTKWTIAVAPRPGEQRSWQAWFVLAGGLVSLAGLGTLLLVITGRASDLEATVSERTREVGASERRFHQLFDESPTAMWECDYSHLRKVFLDLRARGVTDLTAHFRDHAKEVIAATRGVRVIAVNSAALKLFGASSIEEINRDLPARFGPDVLEIFRTQIVGLLGGNRGFETVGTAVALDGTPKTLDTRVTIIPGYEQTWERLVVSFVDLTVIRQTEGQLRAAVQEKESLLLEIHHRVKNNLQIISSLLNLQAHANPEPRLVAAFEETQQRIRSIAAVHEQLYRSKNLARIAIDEYISNVVENLLNTHGATDRGIHAAIEADHVQLSISVAIPCGLIVNELVTNALKHAFPARGGRISIKLAQRDNQISLCVADDGVGLPAEVDPRKATTLGLDLVYTFADQLDGTVDVGRTDGTSFTISFPSIA